MYASSNPLSIDRTQAIAQLTALGYKNGQTVYLRFFFPDGDPRKADDKGRKLEGKFPNLPWALMEQMQAEGRGCYFVVNGGGHNDASVTHGKSVFVEHDNLDKEIQRNLWQSLGLPEPTVQVDTGNKSIHNFWKLKTPCTVEQWCELQPDLLEFADGDRKLKNPSRVMRLAGAYHIKPGREPVQSTLILSTGKDYSYEELRNIVPKQKKQQQQKSGHSQIRWYDFEKTFQMPIEDHVPLYECLTKADRDLIDRGTAEGGRNAGGFALAANLIATTDYLSDIEQNYDGDPQQLFEQYCHNCTPPIDNAEAEAIWRSASQRTESASLPPHIIAKCIRGWKWRQIRENQQQSEQQKQVISISEHGSKKKIVDHPTANRETLNTEELKDRITALIAEDRSQSELEAVIPDLAHLANRQTRDVWALYRAMLAEINESEERETTKKALPSLLKVKQQRLDPYEYLWGDNGKLAKQLIETAIAMPTAVEFLITTLIPVCGSLIGTSARIVIRLGNRYVQPAVYRTCVVAPSGFKKTPAQLIIIDPLDELNSEEYKLWAEAQEQYKADKEQYDRSAKSRRKDDDDDDPPKEPQNRKQYIVSDTTYEALIKTHSENPQGLLLYRDEWSAHITARNKYRNGSGDDAQNELSEFNGKSLSKNRMKESLFLERTAISRTGSTQPETLKLHMGDHMDFSGEFGRWLFCAAECPLPYIDLLSPDADVDIGIHQNLRTLYKRLLQLPKGDYFLADDAKAVFQEYQHHLVDWTLEETQQGLKTAYPKFETYFVRLILWLHVVNGVLAGITPQKLISGKTVSKAASLTDYFIGQLRLIYAHNSPDDQLKGRLLDIKHYIEGKPDGVTPREIKAKNWKFRKIPTVEIVQDCKTLESAGYIYSKDGRYYPTRNGGSDDTKTPPPKPPNTGSDNSPSNRVVDVVDESSTPPSNPEPPNNQASPQSDSESVDVVDVLLMNHQHPQPHTDKGVEPFVDVVDENSNDTRDGNGTTPDQPLEVLMQNPIVDVASTKHQQHQQNAVIQAVSNVEGVDETSTKHQQHQHSSVTEPSETPKIGDRVRTPDGQLGVVDRVYATGELGVAYDNGVFGMWKLTELTIIPTDDHDPDGDGGGNLPVAPAPTPADDGGGIAQSEPQQQAVAETMEDLQIVTSTQETDQQITLALPQAESPIVPVTLPSGVEWLDSTEPEFEDQREYLLAAPKLVLDLETFQPDVPKKGAAPKATHPWQSRIRLVQLSTGDRTFIADMGGRDSDALVQVGRNQPIIKLLRQIVQDPEIQVIGHNIIFDLSFLAAQYGIRGAKNVCDTMQGTKVYFGDYGPVDDGDKKAKYEPILTGGYSLANLANRFLNVTLDKTGQKSDWGAALSTEQLKYAATDPQVTLQVYEHLERLYKDETQALYSQSLRECWQLENDVIACAIDIQLAGLPFDNALAQAQIDVIESYHQPLKEEWGKLSPDIKYTQIIALKSHLNEKYQLGLTSLAKGELSAEARENPLIQLRAKLDGLDTHKNYLKNFQTSAARDGRVHTEYKTLTGTGRFSSGNGKPDLPNLQSIKVKTNPALNEFKLPSVRSVIKPKSGRTMAVIDLAGAHGRIAASETQDKTAIVGNNDPTIDNHLKVAVFIARAQGLDWTAEYIGKARKDASNPDSTKAQLLRDTAKNTFYGFLNGAGAVTVQRQVAGNTGVVPPLADCKAALEGCKKLYPGVPKHHKKRTRQMALHAVEIDGRKCSVNITREGFRTCLPLVPGTQEWNKGELKAQYTKVLAAIWSRIESTAVKKALIQVMQLRAQHPEWNLEVINYVHDELDLECDSEYAHVAIPLCNDIIGDSFASLLNGVSDGRETNWEKLVVNSWADK